MFKLDSEQGTKDTGKLKKPNYYYASTWQNSNEGLKKYSDDMT